MFGNEVDDLGYAGMTVGLISNPDQVKQAPMIDVSTTAVPNILGTDRLLDSSSFTNFIFPTGE